MATQKSMRSFFQVSAASTSSSSKKARLDSSPISQIAISATSLLAVSGDQTSSDDKFQTSSDDKLPTCPPGLTDEGWKNILSKEFVKPYYKTLTQYVDSEYEKTSIYPPKEQIFSAFNLCPFNNVKVNYDIMIV